MRSARYDAGMSPHNPAHDEVGDGCARGGAPGASKIDRVVVEVGESAPAGLPPDRSWVSTEHRNARTGDLHRLSVGELVARIQEEDARVLSAVEGARGAITALIARAEPGFSAGGRLIYVGAGTSGRLGVLDAAEAPPTFQTPPGRVVGILAGGEAAIRSSSEGLEDDREGALEELAGLGLTADDTVIGIAAGGTTPYVLGALSIAKRLSAGVLTALVTCANVCDVADADCVIVLETGPEVITGSTRMKAGTATKLVLNTISTALMVRTGKVYENLMVDVRATNAKLRDRAARIVSTLTGLGREEAFGLLARAEGSAKAAVVMHRLGVDVSTASAYLARHGGRLDGALGEGGRNQAERA